MACEFGYRLTGKAEADLDNILSYMAVQLANSQAAAAFLEKLQAAISEACLFPESGSPVDNAFLPCKIIRKKQVGSYILYYFPDEKAETILFGRRNLDEILREMNGS